MKGMEEFIKREFSDSDEILKLDRDGLLFEIWKCRADKLNWGLIGILIGWILTKLLLFLK